MKEYKLGDLMLVTYLTLTDSNQISIVCTPCIFNKIKNISIGTSFILSDCFQSIVYPFKTISSFGNVIRSVKYLA